MGGGIMVPLHRASFVVVPEIGIRIASNDQHRHLVEESDASRALISFDWITDCVEREKLLDLNEYKLRISPYVSFDLWQTPISGTYANFSASSITSENTTARTGNAVYPNNSKDNDDNSSHVTTPKNVAKDLTGETVLSGPPTPMMTPPIDSVNTNLEDLAWAKLTHDKSGVTTESAEVPNDLMTSFFWLQDQLEVWSKSDFGGSLVGFFMRVKMQVSHCLLTIWNGTECQDSSRPWHEMFHTYQGLYIKAVPGLREKMAIQV